MASRRPRLMILGLALLVAGALAGSEAFSGGPTPAQATFHIANIDEVMSGVDGDPSIQYVEVNMLTSGQNLVMNTRLMAFNAAGMATQLLLVPGNVLSAVRDSCIMLIIFPDTFNSDKTLMRSWSSSLVNTLASTLHYPSNFPIGTF